MTSMLEKIKAFHEKLKDETFLNEFIKEVNHSIAMKEKKDEDFWNSDRRLKIEQRIKEVLKTQESISDNVYSEPLIKETNGMMEVTNEEFISFVSLTIKNNQPSKKDKENIFDNEYVIIDDYRYGVIHGQGSLYFVNKIKNEEK